MQKDYAILKTVWIQISWFHQKPADQDPHFLFTPKMISWWKNVTIVGLSLGNYLDAIMILKISFKPLD